MPPHEDLPGYLDEVRGHNNKGFWSNAEDYHRARCDVTPAPWWSWLVRRRTAQAADPLAADDGYRDTETK